MNSAFLKAAASYYGINPDQLRTSDWRNDGGSLVVSFEMTVSEADLEPIMARMKEMRQAPVFDVEQPKREVKHIDVPEVEDNSRPDAVWVLGAHLVGQQVMMASDSRLNREAADNEYLLQTIMLTPEQRARYVQQGEQHG